jgi:uronate dehydrogenase
VTSTSEPLVVVTGASGVVGRRVVSALEDTARLRLVDLRPGPREPRRGESLALDLRDDGAWEQALQDADAVVHLAANASPAQDARHVISGVAELAAGLADALEASSVSHVIMASSIHTIGMHDVAEHWPVRATDRAWPCCAYGAAKSFAENVLSLSCAARAAVFTSLRLGLVGWDPVDERYQSNWTSDRDFMNVVREVVRQRPSGALLVASNGARGRWDIEATEHLLGLRLIDDPPAPSPPSWRGPDPRCRMLGAPCRSDAGLSGPI